MNKMKETTLGIIGQGFVGNAMYQGFKDFYPVLTYDKYIEEKSNSTLENLVMNSDVIFSCVPTPMTDVGECYTGIVEEVLGNVNNICIANDITNKIVVIKSTVIPGTTKIISFPTSFLTIFISSGLQTNPSRLFFFA